MNPIFQFDIQVPASAVDGNGHVNNVVYVQWMQDAAIAHATAAGCTALCVEFGATWVARTHKIEYLRPAFAGERVTVLTWVADFRKVRSLRKYKFLRVSDATVLAVAETDWVLVRASNGRPLAIPAEMQHAFQVVNQEQEP
jgi:acyl-CoA thioester hydrolase